MKVQVNLVSLTWVTLFSFPLFYPFSSPFLPSLLFSCQSLFYKRKKITRLAIKLEFSFSLLFGILKIILIIMTASLLKDLTFLNDGNLDILCDNPELINFGKLRKLEEIMEQIQTFQKYKYNFEKSQLIQNIVLTSDHWDDSKNYAESLICEDREGKTAAMRGEVVTEHNDIVINLDVNLTPEQLEAAEKTHHQWSVFFINEFILLFLLDTIL